MGDNKPREVGLREARTDLAELVTDAAVRGTITYLTNRGRRVAAIVPVPVAESAEAFQKMADRPPAKPLRVTEAQNFTIKSCTLIGEDGHTRPIPDTPAEGRND